MSELGSAQRKMANFELALAALERFVAEPQRTGIIQAFEFTFELGWKVMQARARSEGLDVVTPRASIGAGLKLDLVEDEQLWLDMLESRSLASHTYRPELAREVVEAIERHYLPAFVALRIALRRAG